MKEVKNKIFKGERPLFSTDGLYVEGCEFEDGESPLKESSNIELNNCTFKWKYPLWYCENVMAGNCTLEETARAGIWYSNKIEMDNCIVNAPKTFRRCDGVTVSNTVFFKAEETLWHCNNIKLKNVKAQNAFYFAMNSSNTEAEGLQIEGNYSFDGAKNVLIKKSRLISKDSFWNCDNVTVYDTYITGEYLGWNSKNLTFINCTIESLQGMCFIDGLKLINCELINTTLAFEHSNVEAELKGSVDSIFNPASGTVKAERIKELIIEKDKTNPEKIHIICDAIDKVSDKPEWIL